MKPCEQCGKNHPPMVDCYTAAGAPSNVEQVVIEPRFDFAWAARTDPVVSSVCKLGLSAEDAVVELVKQKQQLLKHIELLEAIAPRKYRVGGQTYIWRCPDHMVPDR